MEKNTFLTIKSLKKKKRSEISLFIKDSIVVTIVFFR